MILAVAVLLCIRATADNKHKLTIDAATVFLNGAELTSSAKLNLEAGENEIIFTNVATTINNASIALNATNGVVVAASSFQNTYLPQVAPSPRVAAMKDSIKKLEAAKVPVNIKIAVLEKQLAILEGSTDDDEKTPTVAEVAQRLDLINARMEGYMAQKARQEAALAIIDERVAQLLQQLQDEQSKGYINVPQIAVKLHSSGATATTITVSYNIATAGWVPVYDIMATDVNKPVKLFYKANVHQNSGVAWDKVKLTLSTGNPQESIQAPSLIPWYVSMYVPPVYADVQQQVGSSQRVLAYKKPLVDISAMPATELKDVVSLTPPLYQGKRGADVSIGGARTPGTLYVIDGVQVQGQTGANLSQTSVEQYVSVNNSGVNTSFDIELPYSIPSDGKQHLVVIKKYEMPATYRHYAVPKLDKDAFLQARIANWDDMNLLPGQANIFYENSYIGQGHLELRTTQDTLLISLGRDKKVSIKREQDKKLRTAKHNGDNVTEEFAFTITVRNGRKEKIDLLLLDQVPVSTDKGVTIDSRQLAGGELDDTKGFIKWNPALAATETRKFTFGYTIKYPKNKAIVGLR